MISVCIATYNGEKYIENQLKSILSQLSPDDEVIISDDSSTDSTVKVINNFDDPRIKVVIHEKDHGFTRNFENALSHATGEFIFLSDQDDEWYPNKVKVMMNALKSASFTVSDCVTVDAYGKLLDQSRFKMFNIKKGFWRLMLKTRYLGCCMAFRREVLKAALPFPSNTHYVEHDVWLAAVSECYFKVELINEPLIMYKRHGDNVSDGGMGKGYPLSDKIKRRIYRIWKLWCIRNKVKKIKQKELK